MPKRRARRSLPTPVDTEVEAYGFIRDQLREMGWNIKNPSRSGEGQVWTQNQCLSCEPIKTALGTTRPENIVKLSESLLWVIEAKRDRKALDKAVREATDDYAAPIISGGALARIIHAVAIVRQLREVLAG
ncbi:MAG: hypothetical protein H0T47_22695 [Planctomycetaceae bacterium]|nr:hypothetical protein [Planctomycetaceae bacterium]